MKIAVQTGGITGHFNFNLRATLHVIKRCGFTAIDWNIPTGIDLKQIVEKDYSKNVFEKDIEKIKEHYAESIKLIKEADLEITQMHAPFPAHIPESDDLLDYMIGVYKKLIVFADYVNCKNLIIHGACYRSDFPDQTEEFLESLNLKMYEALIPTLLKTNVTVCLENLFTWHPGVPFEGPGHCSDPEKAIKSIDYLNQKAGKECFGLCFDTGHALLVGLDIKEYIIKLGSRIKALHIHDNDGATDLHTAPYTGKLNWNDFCEGLKAINYKGDLSFETFGQVYKNRIPTEMLETWLKTIANCGNYFKNKILTNTMQVEFLEDELWWGGEVGSFNKMPISAKNTFKINFRTAGHNQTAPLFLSNKGRIIYSKSTFSATFENGIITLQNDNNDKIEVINAGENLRDAYDYAAHNLYTFEKRNLPTLHFIAPQYNTWVQMGYMQSQEGVLSYAEGLIKNGYKPGVLMIDEGWQKDYGDWRFNERFPNPKEMVEKLHAMGFKVMLWVVPYLSVSSPVFRPHWFDKDNYFCRTFDDQPAIDHWWNGYSTSFNLCLEGDRKILTTQLKALMTDYEIDGFKFDGGNVKNYRPFAVNGKRHEKYPPEELNMAWNDFGAKYEYHEYKDTFNRMGRAVIQRVCDTAHSWEGNGINKLIPSGLMQNLLGYPYNCPDMIGGGCISSIEENVFNYDGELFVRTAQLAAFFPIMQFSAAPFEVLDKKYADLVKAAADLHIKLSDYILKLVKNTMETGAPIMQHMEYAYPCQGFEKETEQFMLGENLLVAPVINQGETKKRVVLPKGKWKAENGEIFEGNQTIMYPAPLEVIPYFEKI